MRRARSLLPSCRVSTCTDLRHTVESFIASAVQPSLLDAGEEPLRLVPGQWEVREWNGRLVLEAWDGERSLARKILRLTEQKRDRLRFATERFPRAEGETQIADLAAPGGLDLRRQTSRRAFSARFRLMLARQFPGWRVTEVSNEPNLELSFSPLYARALLRMGSQAVAAIAASPGSSEPAGIVAQGLLWLDWVRRRERKLTVGTLVYFLPEGLQRDAVRRVALLDPRAAAFHLHTFDERDRTAPADFADIGNAESSVPPCHRPLEPNSDPCPVPAIEGVDRVAHADGSVRLRVNGLEFAQWSCGALRCGIGRRRIGSHAEVEAMARELLRLRRADAEDRQHPLYSQFPEGWLEAAVRANPQIVDAGLRPAPLYGQVPVFTDPGRDVVDLLGVDHDGRLAILELKAGTDLQLPFQALDYWIRVNRHLQARDFERQGYFPGVTLRRDAPRILLAAPALAFHSSSETVLSFLQPGIDVTRVGLAEDWRRGLRVMFRLRGAERP